MIFVGDQIIISRKRKFSHFLNKFFGFDLKTPTHQNAIYSTCDDNRDNNRKITPDISGTTSSQENDQPAWKLTTSVQNLPTGNIGVGVGYQSVKFLADSRVGGHFSVLMSSSVYWSYREVLPPDAKLGLRTGVIYDRLINLADWRE